LILLKVGRIYFGNKVVSTSLDMIVDYNLEIERVKVTNNKVRT